MAAIAMEIAVNVGIFAALFWVLLAVKRRVVEGRDLVTLEALAFAGCFALGQARILGEFPWPPVETAHVLIPLAFLLVASRPHPAVRLSIGLIALNVGFYFAVVPLFEEAPGTVVIQWLAVHAGWAMVTIIAGRVGSMLFGAGLAAAMFGLGVVIIAGGSTSLAMTAWLLGAMTAAHWVVARWRPGPLDDRTLVPAFGLLLAVELVNYVW